MLDDRFWSKVDKRGDLDCWLWTAALTKDGYSRFARPRVNGERGPVAYGHRISWENVNGQIPLGMHIHHLCRVRRCVNPVHLEVVAPAENSRLAGILNKGSTYVQRTPRAPRTECTRGHPFDEENTMVEGDRRKCRACWNEARRIRRAKAAAR